MEFKVQGSYSGDTGDEDITVGLVNAGFITYFTAAPTVVSKYE